MRVNCQKLRYLNNCVSRLFPNPGLFHSRVKSKHSTNSRHAHAPKQQCLHRTSVVAPEYNNCKRQCHQSACPKLYITSDTSKAGCGACCQNLTANGCWSPLETKDHINVLKLKAAFLATKAFHKDRSHLSVSLHGQYHSGHLCKQQRGNSLPSFSHLNSKIMAVVPSNINSGHRSAPSRQTQQCSRQRVKRVL